MIEIRKKDRIFVAVLLPVLLTAAYIYFWRIPSSRSVDTMKTELSALPDPEMFPMEERTLKARLQNAKNELEKIKAEKRPPSKIAVEAGASPAERQEKLFKAMRDAGIEIIRTSPFMESTPSKTALAATGLLNGVETVKMSFAAPYATVVKLLKQIEDGKKAVVFDSLFIADTSKRIWEAVICY